MVSDKARTNKKWTSTEQYRDNYDKIFGRRKKMAKYTMCRDELVPHVNCDIPPNDILFEADTLSEVLTFIDYQYGGTAEDEFWDWLESLVDLEQDLLKKEEMYKKSRRKDKRRR